MNTALKPLIKQGWIRAMLYIIALFGVMLLIGPLAHKFALKLSGADEAAPAGLINFFIEYGTTGICILALTYAFRKIVDRQNFVSLGFEWRGFTNEAWIGFFSGPLLLGIGSLLLVVAGYTTFTGLEFKLSSILPEILAMLMVAFVEEIMFRGYLLNNLMESVNKWIALGITALLFGFVHLSNPDVSVIAVVNILVAGFFLGINYVFTRNLWFGIFFHFSWNFFQGPVIGFDVSGLPLESVFRQSSGGPTLFTGGPFGFEGSVLCPVLLIILGWFLLRIFSKRYKILPV